MGRVQRGAAAWALATALAAGALVAGAPAASGLAGTAPVPGRVARSFDPPELRWGVGHRGVDLLAGPGGAVRAPAAGVITFAGVLAGRGVVVVSHGELRTTLEPVEASVRVGQSVTAGQVVGRLASGHSCPGGQCLHWGLKRGADYLDPLSLLSGAQVRLLPDAAAARARARAELRLARQMLEAAAEMPAVGATRSSGGPLARPVSAAVGSRFGMRLHPIFKVWRLHAGVDMGARCGSPIRAAADGVVSHMGYDSSGGWRLVVDHAPRGGASLSTSYLHAQGYGVRAGERVRRGQVVGWVGSTGWSTACHLHFGTKLGGKAVDPQGLW